MYGILTFLSICANDINGIYSKRRLVANKTTYLEVKSGHFPIRRNGAPIYVDVIRVKKVSTRQQGDLVQKAVDFHRHKLIVMMMLWWGGWVCIAVFVLIGVVTASSSAVNAAVASMVVPSAALLGCLFSYAEIKPTLLHRAAKAWKHYELVK